MFLKPFRVKSNTQMKGSDKKKLKATLKKHFPKLSDEDLNILLPTKDEIVVSKIYTFAEESVLLYIHGKNAVFFELEKEKIFYPSVSENVYRIQCSESKILLSPIHTFPILWLYWTNE